MTARFNATDVLHPLDISARQQLESIPMLQAAVKRYLSAVADRKNKQELLASALRLGPRQLPEIYRMLPPICDAFGIEEPELYLMRGEANAATVGHSRPAIIIFNQLLEDLDEDETQAVLAHECGHIAAEHILYRQMALAMIRAGQGAGNLGGSVVKAVAMLATSQVQPAMLNWYRKSELTADRAAVAFFGNPEPMQRALYRMLGVPKWMPGDLSYAAFLEQVDEFDKVTETSKWDRYLARGVESDSTHPMPTIRIRELTKWASSDQFNQLMEIAGPDHRADRASCGHCGIAMPLDWRFCQRCGAAVTSQDDSKRESKGATSA